MTQYLTITEAADLIGVSRQSIHEAIARGSLATKTVKIKVERIRRADVLAYKARTGGKAGRPAAG